MIRAQIDELRKWADQLSERENEFGVVVRALVASLRRAADTIWQLRDDLQRTHGLLDDAEHDESRAWDRVRKAEAEADKLRTQLADVTESMGRVEERCAKLRELAEKAWKAAERLCQAFDGPCRDDGVTIDKPCPMGERDEECVYGQLQRELRECGVEVDG